MTRDDLMAARQAQQTEELRQLLEGSSSDIDQLTLRNDPKFQQAMSSSQPSPSPSFTPDLPETFAPIQQWAEDPSRGGLGVAGREPFLPPVSPSRKPEDILARQMFGHDVQMGFMDRVRLRNAMPDIMTTLAQQRQMSAYQQEAVNESKRQHDLQMIEKLMATGNPDALIEYGKQHPESPATLIGQSISKQNMADVAAGVQEGLVPQEFLQRVWNKQATPAEIKAWGDTVVEARKANAKEQAKAFQLQTAMDTPKEKRSPYQAQIVEEHQTALELKKADIDLKTAQAEEARHKANLDPKVTQMAEELSQELFDQPWAKLSQPQRAAVEAMKEKRLQARTATVIQQGLPAPVEKRSNLIDRSAFLKTGAIIQPPPGTTTGDINRGDYVEMTDKQRDEWGQIVNSGATLNELFDMVSPLITATTPGQAAKQFANLSIGAVSKKNPVAATYLAGAEAFSSRMARVFGSEVGVLTQGDVDRWRRTLPTFGDTKQVLAEKRRIFFDIYNQTRAMYQKKIGGEDITQGLSKLREGPLKKAEQLAPPTPAEDLQTLMGP